MSGVNKVILLGRLGGDPELRTTQGGQNVCTFSIATSETFIKNGNKEEKTEWHRVIFWGKQADTASKYLKKGRQVYIEGKIQTRDWIDKDSGVKRYATEIIGFSMQFIGDGNSESKDEYNGAPSSSSNNNVDLSDIPF